MKRPGINCRRDPPRKLEVTLAYKLHSLERWAKIGEVNFIVQATFANPRAMFRKKKGMNRHSMNNVIGKGSFRERTMKRQSWSD